MVGRLEWGGSAIVILNEWVACHAKGLKASPVCVADHNRLSWP